MTPPPYTSYAPTPPPGPWGGQPVFAPLGGPPPDARFSGMAIAGFVLSLVALLPCFWIWIQLPGLLGVIFSLIGMKATKGQLRKGRRLAVAGLIVGLVAIALTIAFTVFVYTSDDCTTDNFQIECNFG
jgi:amino acid transporter